MKNEAFIAWHGSPYTFDRFDFSKLRDGLGVFFTADKPQAEYHGRARQYRLTFRKTLRVHQGEEYAKWLARREGETSRDVRRRLMRDGYDGVRIEYDGGVVDYVVPSNRNIKPMSGDVNVNSVVAKNAHK
jgi:hypothetical protein